ncbi:hypothetical protein MMC30_002085 [Trapelia coarctata]|nr:hypothetical protein [Trapelia coarctata]
MVETLGDLAITDKVYDAHKGPILVVRSRSTKDISFMGIPTELRLLIYCFVYASFLEENRIFVDG